MLVTDGQLSTILFYINATRSIHAYSFRHGERRLMNLKIIISAVALTALASACALNVAKQHDVRESRVSSAPVISKERAGPLYPAGEGALVDLEGNLITPGDSK